MITRRGICYDLDESPYFIRMFGLTFYFSSKVYQEKFTKEVCKYIEYQSIMLFNKFKIETDFSKFLSICYYEKVEKRGFKIVDNTNKNEITKGVVLLSEIKSY